MVPQGPCPELRQTSLPLGIVDGDGPAPELLPLGLFASRAVPDRTGCVAHVGGPVVALDWNPTHSGVLAVAALPSGTPALRATQVYAGCGHIQLWAFHEKDAESVCFAIIAHEGFAAVDLKWAPSAHPDTESLLAAALADGSVVVYELRSFLPRTADQTVPRLAQKPVLISPPVVEIRSAGATFPARRQNLPVIPRTLAWNVDGRGLAVGSTDGSVTVFTLHVQGYHIASLGKSGLSKDVKSATPIIYESWSVTLHPAAAVLAMEWLSPYTLATSGTDGVVRVGDVRDPAVSTESLVDRNIWTMSMMRIPTGFDCFVVGNDQGYLRFVQLRGDAHHHPQATPAATSTSNIPLHAGAVRSIVGMPTRPSSSSSCVSKLVGLSGGTESLSGSDRGKVLKRRKGEQRRSVVDRKDHAREDPMQETKRVLVYAGCSSGTVHEVNVSWPPWTASGSKLDAGVKEMRQILRWRPAPLTYGTPSDESEAKPDALNGKKKELAGLIADVGRVSQVSGKKVAVKPDGKREQPGAVGITSVLGPDYLHDLVASRLAADGRRGLLAVGTLGGFLTIVDVGAQWQPDTELAMTADLRDRGCCAPLLGTGASSIEQGCAVPSASPSDEAQEESKQKKHRKRVRSPVEVSARKAVAEERARRRAAAAAGRAIKLAEAAQKRAAVEEERKQLVQLREEGLRSIEARLEARRLKAKALKPVLEEQKRVRRVAFEQRRDERRQGMRKELVLQRQGVNASMDTCAGGSKPAEADANGQERLPGGT